MPSEAAKVASEASRPTPLMAVAALRGKTSSTTAAAIGSQRVMERTLFIASHRRGARQRARRSRFGPEYCPEYRARCRAPLREYPYEDDHPREEHQRVVADVAGLKEAQQVAGQSDGVRAEGEGAVDGLVDAPPEELGGLLQRADDDRLVQLVDVPLVLQRA